jgi:lactoylglutathione lyase
MVRLIEKLDFPDSKFTLYFLGYHKAKDIPEDRKERVRKFAVLAQLVKAMNIMPISLSGELAQVDVNCVLQVNWMFQQPATLELTHNWGTESDPEAKMHNGNDKPQGYGHIG